MKVTKPGNKRKQGSKKADDDDDDDDDGNEIKEETAAERTNGQAQDASEVGREDGGPKKKLKIELQADDEADV